MKNILYFVLIFFISCSKETQFVEPQHYIDSVIIGNQIWNKNNLDVCTYRNGDTIPEIKDPIEWSTTTTGAWCYYNNDSTNGKIYGKLYNYYAIVDPRNIAPKGWRVPSDSDWQILCDYVGGDSVAASYLKSTGNQYWLGVNKFGKDSYQFNGLPAGYRESTGTFMWINLITKWFTTSKTDICQSPTVRGICRGILSDSLAKRIPTNPEYYMKKITNEGVYFNTGLSVRLIKD